LGRGLSRRAFGRGVALAAGAAAAGGAGRGEAAVVAADAAPIAAAVADAGAAPSARGVFVLAKYASRLTAEQRREIPQLVANAEKSAAKIAEFEVADGDEPAVVFRAR